MENEQHPDSRTQPSTELVPPIENDRYLDAPLPLRDAWVIADELCRRFAFLSFVVSIGAVERCGEPDRRPELAKPFRTSLLELGDLCVQLEEKLDQVGHHFAAVAPRTIKWRGSLLTSIHGLVEEIASSCWHFTVSYIMEWRGINTSSLSSHAAHRDVIATTDFVEHFDTATAGLLGSVPNSKLIGKLRARLFLEFSRACESPAIKAPKAQKETQGRGMSVAEAHRQAMNLAKKDPSFVRGGVREWAKEIGCSTDTVHKTPFWNKTMEKTGRGRGKGAIPTICSLTQQLEAELGEEDEELKRVMEDQEKDYEPSPLDDDPPGRSRQIRHYRR